MLACLLDVKMIVATALFLLLFIVHMVTHSTSMVINLHFMHGGDFTIVSRSQWHLRISSTSQFTQILESESKATFQNMKFEQNSFFSFCVLDIAFTMGSSMSKFVNARV